MLMQAAVSPLYVALTVTACRRATRRDHRPMSVTAPATSVEAGAAPTSTPHSEFMSFALSQSKVAWTSQRIPLDRIGSWRVDEHPDGYQRPVKSSVVQHINENFDSAAARDIVVSHRADGTYWALDGQHTAAVLRQRGFTQWTCRVFKNLSVAEESQWFDHLNNNMKKIPTVVDHNAKVLSHNNVSIMIDSVLADFHLRIASAKLRSRDGDIPFTSPVIFEQILRTGGEALLREVLQLCVDAWGHSKGSFMSRIMGGMGYLLGWNSNPLDRERMLAVLKNTTPIQIVEKIGRAGSGSGPVKSAHVLADLYVVGAPALGVEKFRSNNPGNPQFPDRKLARNEASPVEQFWTDESADIGRVAVHPYVAPPKVRRPRVVAEALEAEVADTVGEDVMAPTTAEAPTTAPEAAQAPQEVNETSPENAAAAQAPAVSQDPGFVADNPTDEVVSSDAEIEDEEWEWPESNPGGTAV